MSRQWVLPTCMVERLSSMPFREGVGPCFSRAWGEAGSIPSFIGGDMPVLLPQSWEDSVHGFETSLCSDESMSDL